MSIEDHGVSFSLEVNIEKAYEEVRRLETVAYRTLALIRRLSGDENVDAAIAKVQRLIAILNQLRLTIAAVQAAQTAQYAATPYAWPLALLSAAGLALNVGDLLMEMNQ